MIYDVGHYWHVDKLFINRLVQLSSRDIYRTMAATKLDFLNKQRVWQMSGSVCKV